MRLPYHESSRERNHEAKLDAVKKAFTDGGEPVVRGLRQLVEGIQVAEGIPPEVRKWSCPQCGTRHLRDENAALNGLAQVLEKLEVPCSGRLGRRHNQRRSNGAT
ncbi:zinc ribbon domain-containing protein [Kyrpidia tusciae]